MEAVKLMASLNALSARLEARGRPRLAVHAQGPDADHRHGQRRHGAQHHRPRVRVRLRPALARPALDPRQILAPFLAEARDDGRALKARAPEAGVVVDLRTNVPPFTPEADGAAEAFARRLAGDNGPPRVVAFAAEAGQFQQAGFSTVICGPGSIDQAHQPDEYVEIAQMERGAAFMRRLIEWAAEPT